MVMIGFPRRAINAARLAANEQPLSGRNAAGNADIEIVRVSNIDQILLGMGGTKVVSSGDVELDGALKHDGLTLGFYGEPPTTQSEAYATTNVTIDRSFNANSTTTDELADVLGTLIADLRATGIIG